MIIISSFIVSFVKVEVKTFDILILQLVSLTDWNKYYTMLDDNPRYNLFIKKNIAIGFTATPISEVVVNSDLLSVVHVQKTKSQLQSSNESYCRFLARVEHGSEILNPRFLVILFEFVMKFY